VALSQRVAKQEGCWLLLFLVLPRWCCQNGCLALLLVLVWLPWLVLWLWLWLVLVLPLL
jgi:hypothetical protein